MTASAAKVAEIVGTCQSFGHEGIILLSGVAGTGKTYLALEAAIEVAGHPAFVCQIQFHPSYAYEDFIEGLRPTASGGFVVEPGIFIEWNDQALADPDNTYVLLIEELSRANVNSVIGELMTYIEYRSRAFLLPLSRRSVTVAPNLVVLATMNPRDRSALEIDDALIRRLRILDCPPDVTQLREMLVHTIEAGDPAGIIDELSRLFTECEARHPETYAAEMPFGHGVFAGVSTVDDLARLWEQRIRYLLRRPLLLPHPFADTIESLYPWRTGAKGKAQTLGNSGIPSLATAPVESGGQAISGGIAEAEDGSADLQPGSE